MSKIRVPQRYTSEFKDFCKRFSHNLEPVTGIRLRGNILLNTMAQASGHDHYKALLMDTATYGDGKFDWDTLPMSLADPLSELLKVQPYRLWKPLMNSVLTDENQFGRIFEADPPDINLQDIIAKQETLVIDLAPVRHCTDTNDKKNLLRMIAHQYLSMKKSMQKKVVFLGEKDDIALLLEVEVSASKLLLENPSIY